MWVSPEVMVTIRARRDAFVREVSLSIQLGAALPGIVALAGVALLLIGEGDPVRAGIGIAVSLAGVVVMLVAGRRAAAGSLAAVTAVAVVWTIVTILAVYGLVAAGDDDNRAMRVLFVGIPFAGMVRAWQARQAVARYEELTPRAHDATG